MELEFIKPALQQAPSLVVLTFLVYIFLRHLREQNVFMRQLHEEHMAARGESRECIKENTDSNRMVTQAVQELNQTVRDERRTHR